MQVILLERIEKLGQIGDVVTVRPGFARNFLFPHQKAVRATKDNVANFEKRKAQIEATNLKQKQEAEKIAAKVEKLSIVILRQASESGTLYGSVSSKDIAEMVTAEGCSITRQQVELPAPVKVVGLHPAFVILHPEVKVEITLNVAQTKEEAKSQLKNPDAAKKETEAKKEVAAATKREEKVEVKEGTAEEETKVDPAQQDQPVIS